MSAGSHGNNRPGDFSIWLAHEAVRHSTRNGAKIIEGYPLLNKDGKYCMVGELFMGFVSTFEQLGFKEGTARSDMRNRMRLVLDEIS